MHEQDNPLTILRHTHAGRQPRLYARIERKSRHPLHAHHLAAMHRAHVPRHELPSPGFRQLRERGKQAFGLV